MKSTRAYAFEVGARVVADLELGLEVSAGGPGRAPQNVTAIGAAACVAPRDRVLAARFLSRVDPPLDPELFRVLLEVLVDYFHESVDIDEPDLGLGDDDETSR